MLEQHLVHKIVRHVMPFFAVLSNLQDPQAESACCFACVQALCVQLPDIGENRMCHGLHGVQ